MSGHTYIHTGQLATVTLVAHACGGLIKRPKYSMYPGCVLYLSILAIKVEKGHCPRAVSNSSANAIVTPSVSWTATLDNCYINA